ncbi:AMP-binding protein, partial [Flavobacterium sp. FlaQc-51]|uniref:AMP-binding protein n=1 Tax=Flavobacterium sp. FlaQc-51 TaxID=3374184 RepID=UPI00375642B5
VPSVLENIELNDHPFLKRVISGGDTCSVEMAAKFHKNFNFYNKYGPTETTVTSIELLYDENKYLSIGKPISNTQIYILSESLELS